jgi:SAM-dependent methyltransferase
MDHGEGTDAGAASVPSAVVRRDFDEIARALAEAHPDDRLRPFERALLACLPAACGRVLEVGCGHGALTRHLAARAESVLAIDLSPEMIRLARSLSVDHSNVEYRVADVMEDALPDAAFDVVLSAATLHHLPLEPAVRTLAAAVKPGGWLLIQDLVTRPGVRGLPLNALAVAAQWGGRLAGSRPRSAAVARLYERHGAGERYLRPDEADAVYAALLPGSRVTHHLEWRYTAAWRRPVS